MKWKTVDDARLLTALVEAKPDGVRIVMFDPEKDAVLGVMSAENQAEAMQYDAAKTFLIYVYKTDPAAVLLLDHTSRKAVACYVWSGDGGPLCGSGDTRVIQLADALEVEFRGGTPIEEWAGPEIVS